MKIHNNEIYFEMKEIATVCNLNEKTITVMVSRGSAIWQTMKFQDDLRKTWIKYSSMKESYKEAIKTAICDGLEPLTFYKAQLLEQEQNDETLEIRLLEAIKSASQYEHYFVKHVTADVRYRSEQLTALSRAASVLELIGSLYKEDGLPFHKYAPLERISPVLQAWEEQMEQRNYTGRKLSPVIYLPASPIRLKSKVKAYFVDKKPLNEVIHVPHAGNNNRSIFKEDTELLGAIMALRASKRNFSDAYIIRKIKQMCTIWQKEVPSDSWFRGVLNDYKVDFLTQDRFSYGHRSGQRFQSSIALQQPMYVGDCWMIDGTRINIAPHRSANGELKYLYWVFIMDAYSKAILGWWFGYAEDADMYLKSMKMATQLHGYLPHEIRYDRFPGHNSQEIKTAFEMLEKRGVKMTKTSKSTGKQYAERVISTIQQVYMQEDEKYIGEGIKSSREYARPHQDYLAKVGKMAKNKDWNFETAWHNSNDIILSYNHTHEGKTGIAPAKMHADETERVNSKHIDTWEVSDLFWSKRKIQVAHQRVSLTVKGQEYLYNLPYEVYSQHGEVSVAFDTNDMTEVYIFDINTAECLCAVKESGRVQTFGASPEWDKLQKQRETIKEDDKRRKKELAELIGANTEDQLAMSLASRVSKEVSESAETAYMNQNMLGFDPTTAAEKKRQTKVKDKPAPVQKQSVSVDPNQSFLDEL